MAAVTTAVPSLSQIQAWTTDHIESAARHWTQTAESWEHAFTTIHREAANPGGTAWHGAAAEAAVLRTGADRVVAVGAADSLCAAATAARSGADDIASARHMVLRAIDNARAAGFVVEEDLSVRGRDLDGPPAVQVARRAQAQTLAAAIHSNAQKLITVDTEVASRITAAIAGVNGVKFVEAPIAPRSKEPAIQAVDYAPRPETPIADPGIPGDPAARGTGPTGAEIWSVIDKLPHGDTPSTREVRTPQDLQRLWDWMKKNGTVITDSYKGSRKGVEFNLADGTRIGQRSAANSTNMPAIDANVPGKDYVKIHINPRGGVPEIPAAPRLDAEGPRVLPPTETSPVRGGGLPGRVFGGGVLPDNTLPHFIEPPETKEIPVIGDGKPDPEH